MNSQTAGNGNGNAAVPFPNNHVSNAAFSSFNISTANTNTRTTSPQTSSQAPCVTASSAPIVLVAKSQIPNASATSTPRAAIPSTTAGNAVAAPATQALVPGNHIETALSSIMGSMNLGLKEASAVQKSPLRDVFALPTPRMNEKGESSTSDLKSGSKRKASSNDDDGGGAKMGETASLISSIRIKRLKEVDEGRNCPTHLEPRLASPLRRRARLASSSPLARQIPPIPPTSPPPRPSASPLAHLSTHRILIVSGPKALLATPCVRFMVNALHSTMSTNNFVEAPITLARTPICSRFVPGREKCILVDRYQVRGAFVLFCFRSEVDMEEGRKCLEGLDFDFEGMEEGEKKLRVVELRTGGGRQWGVGGQVE